MITIRTRVIEYVVPYYRQTGVVPSTTRITTELDISLRALYREFPGGMTEICLAAKIPVPTDRIRQTTEARSQGTSTRQNRPKRGITETDPTTQPTERGVSHELALTVEQKRNLLGIAHLEGKPHSEVLDIIFKRERDMRIKFHLTLGKVRKVLDFLENAERLGWRLDTQPNLLEFVTKLWNEGIPKLSPADSNRLQSFLAERKRLKWEIPAILREITETHNAVYWALEERAGRISPTELRKKLEGIVA